MAHIGQENANHSNIDLINQLMLYLFLKQSKVMMWIKQIHNKKYEPSLNTL